MPGPCTAAGGPTDVFTPLLRLEDRIGGEERPRQPPRHLRHRPPEAGRHARSARGRGRGHRRAAGRGAPELERAAEHDRSSRCTRPSSATCGRRSAAARRRGLRAAHRLRERREPAARRAPPSASARSRCGWPSGRGAAARAPPAPDRERAALAGGRRSWACSSAYGGRAGAAWPRCPPTFPAPTRSASTAASSLFTVGARGRSPGSPSGSPRPGSALGHDVHDPAARRRPRQQRRPGHHRARNGLVVAEISLALVLLVGAGLMLRSFFRVLHADPGFRAEGVLTANVPLCRAGYSEHAKKARRRRADRGAPATPAGRGGAPASTLPLLGGWQSSFSVEGRPEPPPGQRPSADITRVSPGLLPGHGDAGAARAASSTSATATTRRPSAWWTRRSRSALAGREPARQAGEVRVAQDSEVKWMEVVGQSWPT